MTNNPVGEVRALSKTIPQSEIDRLYDLGYKAGFKEGQRTNSSKMAYKRGWRNGIIHAIRLRPRYYRPANEAVNEVLDPYFESLDQAKNNPPNLPHDQRKSHV